MPPSCWNIYGLSVDAIKILSSRKYKSRKSGSLICIVTQGSGQLRSGELQELETGIHQGTTRLRTATLVTQGHGQAERYEEGI